MWWQPLIRLLLSKSSYKLKLGLDGWMAGWEQEVGPAANCHLPTQHFGHREH